MPFRPTALLGAALFAAAFSLTACQSSEEKAEGYYQSGMKLLAEGDEDRALIEFRNVFKYDGFHKEARKTYADTLMKRGQEREAYSQYLRLIEQYPDTVEVRTILAEIAMSRADWAEVERHGQAAIGLTPDEPRVKAIQIALDYRKATLDRDEARRTEVADAARALLADQPENLVLMRVVIDRLVSSDKPDEAMPIIDAAIERDPTSLEFQMLKFRLLALANDMDATGAHLKRMFELFPDNDQVKTSLIGWYMVQRDLDGAEAFLRQLAGDATAAPDGHVAVVQFLRTAGKDDAARAELDRLIAANAGTPNADLYGALRASLDFDKGQRTEAIAAMEAILKDAEATDQTRQIKGMLARMLTANGNPVGARALVEEVLAEDATNVDALKQRAAWLIDEDRPGDAIVDLRTALSQNPRDPAILTLMAAAHERDGSLELAGERLALAVEVSNSGPDEALRYANFLIRQDRLQVAETVLSDSLRANPGRPDLQIALAELYIRMKNWSRAQEIVTALEAVPSENVQKTAQSLRAGILLAQERTDDSLAVLEKMAADGSGGSQAIAMIAQTQLRGDKPAEARKTVDDGLIKYPDDPLLMTLSGSLYAAAGEVAEAEATYRKVVAAYPQAETPARLLYGLLLSTQQKDAAHAFLDEALAAMPDSGTLNWIKAGNLERAGDIEGAIAIYERLYEMDSSNTLVANNLASLITTHRGGAEDLERAFAIARRLRGSDVPAFMDTYGWIEYRRGNVEDALTHLEPAAKGLPDDPLVQFHLGMAYADLGRKDEAIAQLTRAVELAGDSTMEQFATARATIEKLKAAP